MKKRSQKTVAFSSSRFLNDQFGRFEKILVRMEERMVSMEERIFSIERNMVTKQEARKFATKEDLKDFPTRNDPKGFATKDDLKGFATKDDLKGFATKDDLKAFATKDDLKAFGSFCLKHFVTKDEFQDAIDRLATKEDFLTIMTFKDQFAHIVKKREQNDLLYDASMMRHEETLLDHGKRIKVLEKSSLN